MNNNWSYLPYKMLIRSFVGAICEGHCGFKTNYLIMSFTLSVTDYPSTISTSGLIAVLSAASCYRLFIHNLCIWSHPCSLGCFLLQIIHPQSTVTGYYQLSIHNLYNWSHPSSVGCFLLQIIHPQSLHLVSSQFSRLLPVTDYPSTISTYRLIPVLLAASCYRLSIHNLNVIKSSHPSSLSCFLLPIIHP